MNTSLTDFLASLLFLVAQSALPALGTSVQAHMDVPTQRTESTSAQQAPTKSPQGTRKRALGHTPYYDFGRRNPRAKD